MGLLDDRTAIVTGAGHGIGRATALCLAREGARVVVNDIGSSRDGTGSDRQVADDVVRDIEREGGTAVANYDDVASPEGAKRLVELAIDQFSGLDVLVNNAGILRDKTLLKMSEEMWDAVIDTHLKGTFLCTQAAAQMMKNQKRGGRIINTTSVSGMLGNFGQANYSAAKAGIYGLTRTASIELQRYDIMVNAVAPLAKTRLTEDLPMFEKLVDSMTPEHVAPLHLFLASDLSRGVTGHVLSVVGGKLSVYKVVESPGRFKEADSGIWTASEIAEHFDTITKL